MFELTMVELDANDFPHGVLHDLVPSRNLDCETYTHTTVQGQQAHELTCARHVDDLQSPTEVFTFQPLARANINGLIVHEHLTCLTSLTKRTILHEARHTLPHDGHLVPIFAALLLQAWVALAASHFTQCCPEMRWHLPPLRVAHILKETEFWLGF